MKIQGKEQGNMTREEAIQFLDNMQGHESGRAIGKDGFFAELCGYHVQALKLAILALRQKPCEDAIDRSDMLDAIGHGTTYTSEELQRIITNLPSVQPKQRTGKWVLRDDVNGQYQCNECGMFSGLSRFDVEDEGWKLSNFCSNCGARMMEGEETE